MPEGGRRAVPVVGSARRLASDRGRPADHSDVRRHNLSLVLRLLRDSGPLSRAAMAGRTGLTKASVSSLVAELDDRGLVRDLGPDGGKRLGRPATLVGLDGGEVVCIGAELNVDYMAVLATDLAGRSLFEERRAHALGPPEVLLRALVELTRDAITAVGEAHVAGMTIALPGAVDPDAGVLHFAPNLHWREVPVRQLVRDQLGAAFPLQVRNDSKLAALAEQRLGAAAGSANVVFVIGAVGVGGGIVLDGQLARGATGSSGEVGHMTMVRDGAPCGCGSRGCWETLIGLNAVLAQAVPDVAASLIADPELSPQDKVAVVATRARAGDAVALEGLREVGRWLGLGLANLVNLVNPDTIVLAGALRDLGEWLVPEAACVMAEHTVAPAARDVRIELSTIDFPAASRGGAILAAERVFEDPTSVAVLGSGR